MTRTKKPEAAADTEEEKRDLTALGAKAIEIYQKQTEFQERLWSYLSLYSAMLFALSVVLKLLGPRLKDAGMLSGGASYWLIPAVGYLLVAAGNYVTLGNAIEELRILRGEAIAHTGMGLRGSRALAGKLLYIFLVLVVLVAYGFAVVPLFSGQ